ncbi:ribosome small subunit-dependent GTPase A [Acidihalobacter aeolianus]|uniref:Small ribosomal subunit biogenesis GTPase RsgA n=2 Tax=Acidihalobacter TaxID=1765964 RepID=A0A1D8K8J8_9GAMM|nr:MULTISPECIES: ribosome small subunit-dependent GTPase A [Acidihalobacter]AOV17276.1 ribosome small subunit-dependent GTPase A [Acidihalobacter aeolianus]OBS10389.1 ribosome small subunit-dependent GTPase [Acidihalobacter prosperus]
MTRGRVVARFGAELIVRDDAGGLHKAVSPRNLVKRGPEHLRAPVCGDEIEYEDGFDKAVLTALLPRRNCLVRPDHRGRPRAGVANVDQVVIVVATRPPPDWGLIDRYLVGTADLGANAAIVINKIDLALAPAAAAHVSETRTLYAGLGYPVLSTSTLDGSGIDDLRARLAGRTSLFVGQSGVGKSSLTHHLDPNLEVRVGELSALTGEGRHTTTHAHLYALPGGGDLIDSPGVRDFAPFAPERASLHAGFPEIAARIGDCRFHNCQHRAEPGCAIKTAVEAGEIAATRLRSFLELSNELRNSVRGGDSMSP